MEFINKLADLINQGCDKIGINASQLSLILIAVMILGAVIRLIIRIAKKAI
jgi:TRAP-type mannitol/chloroaromatic compound transport system permease small subunit